jgi:hypothetical protein
VSAPALRAVLLAAEDAASLRRGAALLLNLCQTDSPYRPDVTAGATELEAIAIMFDGAPVLAPDEADQLPGSSHRGLVREGVNR